MKIANFAQVISSFPEYQKAVSTILDIRSHLIRYAGSSLKLDTEGQASIFEWLGHPIIVPFATEDPQFVVVLMQNDFVNIYKNDDSCDFFWYEEFLRLEKNEEDDSFEEAIDTVPLLLEQYFDGLREDVDIKIYGQNVQRGTTLEKLRSTPLWEAIKGIDLRDEYSPIEVVIKDEFVELHLIG